MRHLVRGDTALFDEIRPSAVSPKLGTGSVMRDGEEETILKTLLLILLRLLAALVGIALSILRFQLCISDSAMKPRFSFSTSAK